MISAATMTTPTPVPTQADGTMAQVAQDKDQFLKLLIAQIQNQDPLNPMEGTEFMSQLAQMTAVEQATRTNQLIEGLTSSLSISSALNQADLIGKTVTTVSDTFTLTDFGGSFAYELESGATSVSAIIKDSAGNVVKQIDGLSTETGQAIAVNWDGTNSSGELMPAGQYSVSLATPGGTGSYNTYTTSTVESVEFTGGVPMLMLSDGRATSSADIVRVM